MNSLCYSKYSYSGNRGRGGWQDRGSNRGGRGRGGTPRGGGAGKKRKCGMCNQEGECLTFVFRC